MCWAIQNHTYGPQRMNVDTIKNEGSKWQVRVLWQRKVKLRARKVEDCGLQSIKAGGYTVLELHRVLGAKE